MSTAEFIRQAVKSATTRSALLGWRYLRRETAKTKMSLVDFREQIPIALRRKKELGIEGGSRGDPVFQLFQHLDTSSWEDWMMYAHSDPDMLYTRNLIDTDNQSYSLLLLCWNPGKESPIHDHPGDGCWVKVMQGAIQERRYRHLEESGDGPLYCYQDLTARTGDVTYIDDTQGFHKVGNPGPHISATLHLYSPSVLRCKTWLNESGLPQNTNLNNYSEFGVKT